MSLLWHGLPNSGSLRPERRAGARYSVELGVRYRILDGDCQPREGCGQTINLSPGGVLFHADCNLAAGTSVQLSIAWPRRLGEICPLVLLITGRILRSQNHLFAVHADRYEFRTHGSPAFHEDPETPGFRFYF